jgi:hypothetical protein
MQVDVSEENENAEEEPYIVENPTLVSSGFDLLKSIMRL